MHSRVVVDAALRMTREGIGASSIAEALGVPARTIRDWRAGRVPGILDASRCTRCHACHPDLTTRRDAYAYLLGLYLGDGCLSAHPRAVYRLRIVLDQRYPGIIDDALQAVRSIAGRGTVQRRPDGCVEVCAYWRSWPCLLPQHGPGKKHERRIELVAWQQEIVDHAPEPLIRGLIHSDGCRATNTGRGGWSHPRYSFSNRSEDIHAIFRAACERIGVRWTAAPRTTYVSRVADVARLDAFIGPKA